MIDQPGLADPFLEVRELTLQYKTSDHLVTAAYDVSFQVYEADRLILLGPSGCGKSTILKAIGGYIQPAHGTIALKGKNIAKPGADRGMVFQEFDQLLPWKTALENIIFAIRATRKLPRRPAEAEARDLLQKVGLTAFANSYPHELSGGMKQRIAIARCLAIKSAIILMDEPFASLDAQSRGRMQQELLSLWQDSRCTIIFVTHSIDEAIVLGSRIVIFSAHPGQVVAELNADFSSAAETAALHQRISHILFKDMPEYVI
ncbi:MAG: ABC transporter ATP-binding protein [Candidatus Adiutrix sp.]|nr:ABC transporter ATP-binding protein [Candidatus Adiutrix sp.]